jgi:hypothetical protein
MKSYFMKPFNNTKTNDWEDKNRINRNGIDHIDPHEWIELRIGTRMCKKCRKVEEIGDEIIW